MDTSKKYIKMCEKAKEIQKQWEPKEGDFVKWDEEIVCLANYEDSLLVKVEVSCGRSTDYQDEPYLTYLEDERNNCIWLPRQDQLQEMAQRVTAIQIMNIFIKYHWQDVRLYKYRELFQTLEQHWLAFIMKEKYHKIWNGEDWINENSGD